jgi:hypothetical protein
MLGMPARPGDWPKANGAAGHGEVAAHRNGSLSLGLDRGGLAAAGMYPPASARLDRYPAPVDLGAIQRSRVALQVHH